MKNIDYYKILQVDPNAEPEVIEGAWKRLSKKYHPDTNKSPDATRRMQEINNAYDVLSNPEKRAAYDRERGKARTETRDETTRARDKSRAEADTRARAEADTRARAEAEARARAEAKAHKLKINRIVLLIFAVTISIVVLCVVLWPNNSENTNFGSLSTVTPTPSHTATPITTAQLKSYSNEYYSIQYPYDWELAVTSDTPENFTITISKSYPLDTAPSLAEAYADVELKILAYVGGANISRYCSQQTSMAELSDDYHLISCGPPQNTEQWDLVLLYEQWGFSHSLFWKFEPNFDSDLEVFVSKRFTMDDVEWGNQCDEIIDSISFK